MEGSSSSIATIHTTDNDSDTDSDCVLPGQPTAGAHVEEEGAVGPEIVQDIQEAAAEQVDEHVQIEQGRHNTNERPRRVVHPPGWHADYEFN